MHNQLYRLCLDDCSMPGFCSFNTDYIGTLNDVESFIEAIRQDEKFADIETRLIEAWNSYAAGNHNVTYNAAYQENIFLVRVNCLGTAETVLMDYEWEHLNTWDCTYSIRCAKAESTHVWLSYQGKYCRCIRTRFTDLAYKNIMDGYSSLAGSFWGYPHMIETDGNVTYHRMYVLEKAFKNKEETLLDIDNFKTQPDIAFRNVLNDIFGDG